MIYKWFHPRSVAGVVVQLGAANGGLEYEWAILEQVKGKAIIKEKGHVSGSAEQLKGALQTDVPAALSITGKGVLVRKVSQAKTEQLDTLAQELLPGANAQDYYFDMVPASLGQVMVAMVRRKAVDDLLVDFQAQGINVLSLSIGPLAVAAIASLISMEGAQKQLDIAGYSIKFNHDDVPEQIERSSDNVTSSYQIAGEMLNAAEVLPFATALGFWLSPSEELISKEPVGQEYEEYVHKRFFQMALKGALGVFFVALMLNFVLFNQQYQLNSELKQLSGNKQERLKQFELFKRDYDQNLSFLGGEGWLKPARASYFADELASTVPKEIVLTLMAIYPDTLGKKNTNDRSRYNTSLVLVMGQVNSSVLLQEWTATLRDAVWVQSVTVKNYSQENPKALGEFNLEVQLKQ